MTKTITLTLPISQARDLLVHLAFARTTVQNVATAFPDSAIRDAFGRIEALQKLIGDALAADADVTRPVRAARVLPPVQRQPVPPPIEQEMKLYRMDLGPLPPAYVSWHRELASARAEQIAELGCEIAGSSMEPDGWMDGMKVMRLSVKTPGGRWVQLVWHDGSQDFFVKLSSGGSCAMLPEDLL